MIAIRAVGSEAVGINLSLRTLVGRAVLTYRVQSSGSADNHIYFAIIPMQETGIGRSGLIATELGTPSRRLLI